MIPPSTSDNENYNGYLIISRSRYLGPNAWTYTVDIQAPDGKWLPPVADHDNTWDSSEAAVAEGMRTARSIVGRHG